MDLYSLCLLVCIMFVVYVMVLLFHEITRNFESQRYMYWLYDLLASIELVAATITLSVILSRFGTLVFAVCAVANLSIISTLAHDRRFPGRASVLYPFREMLLGHETVINTLFSCIAMVGGGILAGYLLPIICDAFRTIGAGVDVPNNMCGQSMNYTLQGLLIEAAATFIQIIILRELVKRDGRMDSGIASRLFAFFTVLVVHRRWVTTGFYANSMLATSIHYNCTDVTNLNFIKVYWVGPLLGVMVAMAVFRELRGVHKKVKIM